MTSKSSPKTSKSSPKTSKTSPKRGQNVKAVILDIDGTTTDITFISKKLFPLITSNLHKFLDETYDSTEIKDLIRALRQLQMSGSYSGMPVLVVGNKEQVIRSVENNLKWQMNNCKTTELKAFELLCWLWAYQTDLIKAHIYDDVPPSLHNWKTKSGIKIYTFSSGITLAQKLLFVKTIHGNIYSLIDQFFDSSIGSKTDIGSYKLISKNIGLKVNQILFITDDPKEAKAAINAGLQSFIIKRPGNKATKEFSEIARVKSFKNIIL